MSFEEIKKRSSNVSVYPSLIILTVCTFIYLFLMTMFTSAKIDDLYYTYAYRHWLLGEGEFPGLSPWMDTIKAHFLTVNGRFGDKLLIGYLLLPKWLDALIASATSIGFMLFGVRIALGSPQRHPILATLLVVAFIICLPWWDSMFLGCMAVNYILASFWGLWALAIYFRPTKDPHHNVVATYAGALLLGFLAGSWHECFTFIVAPGLILYPFITKRLSKLQLCILIGGILGAVFIISNPGFWVRYDNQMHFLSMRDSMYILEFCNLSLLFLVLFPILICFKKTRQLYTRRDIGIMSACVIALPINIVIFSSNLGLPRALWFGVILGLIGLAILAKPIKLTRIQRVVSLEFTWALVFFCIIHFAVTVHAQYRIDREFKEVTTRFHDSADGIIFYDEVATKDVPWLALNRPSDNQFYSWRIDNGIMAFYKNNEMALQLVPTVLRDFDPNNAILVDSIIGLYNYAGYYVLDGNNIKPGRWTYINFDPMDTKEPTRKMSHRFRDRNGHEWVYLRHD